jgi:dethiobiotin synthetase
MTAPPQGTGSAPPEGSGVGRGLFVTGTDTGVGKTVVAGAVAAALTRRGARVAAFKPVVTGLDEPAAFGWAHDHALLAAAAGTTPEEVSPARFGPAVSPHLAAARAGTTLDVEALLGLARAAAARSDVLVAEGVGGLLVPLTDSYTVRDFAVALGLPLLVAARPGLGTISHTLLTLEAARAGGLNVLAVVITPWPDEPSAMERSNRETIERLGKVEVHTIPLLPSGLPADLAPAGEALPLKSWLA